MANAAPLFSPIMPPIPAPPCTPLGRALLDNWGTEGAPLTFWHAQPKFAGSAHAGATMALTSVAHSARMRISHWDDGS